MAASPAEYMRWQSYSSWKEKEKKKKRKKILVLTHVNADLITSLSTCCLCHHIVINNDACLLEPAVLCANGRRHGGESVERPDSFFCWITTFKLLL